MAINIARDARDGGVFPDQNMIKGASTNMDVGPSINIMIRLHCIIL